MSTESASTKAVDATDLFNPVKLGPYELKNRIVMAPLTRSRADDAGVPGVKTTVPLIATERCVPPLRGS